MITLSSNAYWTRYKYSSLYTAQASAAFWLSEPHEATRCGQHLHICKKDSSVSSSKKSTKQQKFKSSQPWICLSQTHFPSLCQMHWRLSHVGVQGLVQLHENHEVGGQARPPVTRGHIDSQPWQRIVGLKDIPARHSTGEESSDEETGG